jgi:hypothetical protein
MSSEFSMSKAIAQRAFPSAISSARMETVRFAVGDYDKAADYARDIGRLWSDAQKSFLAIGRNLVRAKQRLAHGEFEAMVASDLPFGKSTAYQLRVVAEAVDSGRIPERDLPSTATTAYHLACLPPEDLELAKQAGLVRADAKREEVARWKKARKPQITIESDDAESERKRKEARLAELRAEIAAIERELASLQG